MLPRSPGVRAWLDELPAIDRDRIDEALDYLEEHGRAATFPDVLVPIRASEHYPRMGEVRIDLDRTGRPAPPGENPARSYRVLFVFGPDGIPVLLVAGDKAGLWNEWYVTAVPQADRLYDAYHQAYLNHQRRTR